MKKNVVAAFLILSSFPLQAGSPSSSVSDAAVIWDTSSPILYRVDSDSLGILSQSEALVIIENALQVWSDATGGLLQFEYDGLIGEDITSLNYDAYLTDLSLVGDNVYDLLFVFDNDRSVLDLLGSGSSTVGVAQTVSSSLIYAAIITINGMIYDGAASPADISEESLEGLFLHEIGHALGMAHNTLNLSLAGDVSGYQHYLPTLWPFITDGIDSLHPDDEATVAGMYNVAPLTLSGVVTDSAGTGLDYIRVTAREISSPYCKAYSALTSWPDNSVPGRFVIPILETGNYVVEVEEYSSSYPLAGGAEFYNSGDAAVEDAETLMVIPVTASMTGLDIVLAAAGTDVDTGWTDEIDGAFYANHPETFTTGIEDPDCPLPDEPGEEETGEEVPPAEADEPFTEAPTDGGGDDSGEEPEGLPEPQQEDDEEVPAADTLDGEESNGEESVDALEDDAIDIRPTDETVEEEEPIDLPEGEAENQTDGAGSPAAAGGCSLRP